MRIKVLRVIFGILFVALTSHLIYLQLLRGPYFYHLSRNNRIRVISIEGQRGRIFDRNGVVLADNRRSLEVVVIPQELKGKALTFDFLGRALGMDKEKLLKSYEQKMSTPFAPVVVAEDVSRNQAITIEENKFNFPGLFVQETFRRVYPYGEKTSHLLGYVGKINRSKIEELKNYGYNSQSVVGYSGGEEFYDRSLKGEEGGMQIEVNSRGEQVRLLGFKEPLKGQDITLTINVTVQEILTELLENKPGVIIVMELDSGEILGMASSPRYDPNLFVQKTNSIVSSLFSDPHSPLLNRAIGGQYPPGSIFKIAVALCALKERKITPHLTFHCPGFYRLGDREFRCTHAHGDQDLFQAIAHSCNVYFYRLALMVGPEAICRYAKNLGLGRPAGIDLPYEAAGHIPNPQLRKIGRRAAWYRGDILNLAIGQGEVLTTPLQLVEMMAIIALDGKRPHPHIIKAIGSSPVKASLKPMAFLDQKSWEAVKQGMELVVTRDSGTAHLLEMPDLLTAGKTGTAQTSSDREPHAWFVGYSVSRKNRIAFVVLLEHGGASLNACLLAKDLLGRLQKEGFL